MDAENFGEPWILELDGQYDIPRNIIASQGGDFIYFDPGSGELDILPTCDQWRRIVAAVNACRGIPTQDLESYGDGWLKHALNTLDGLIEPSSGI